ncbi:MAG: hypothetical protein D6702_07980 [Planctomycetota bacterium]|nr:MAG: hypothetical protein D6702_07980 [Planctomycetota bacterium]
MRRPGLGAVVLAAGAGRRLGRPKAALHLRGRWMLPRIVAALRRGGAVEVVLVLSAAAREAIAGLGPTGADREVLNPTPESGRTGSLLLGLAELPEELPGLLVHPCDVPLLTAAAVAEVVRAWNRCPDRAQRLARPVTPGGRGGHPLLVGAAGLPRLRSFPPDRPLRALLDEDRRRVLDVPLAGDPGPFLDVDTPEQLALLEDLLARPPGIEADPQRPGRD